MPRITCPNCKNEFEPEDAIAKSLEKEYADKFSKDAENLRKKYADHEKNLEEKEKEFEKKKEKENELFAERIQKEKLKIENELQQQLRKSISGDYENQLKILQQANNDNEEKLKSARQKELNLLRERNELEQRTKNNEIEIEKKILEERKKIEQDVIQREKELSDLRLKEKDIHIASMHKTIEDLKRKSEQGSMQVQGEAQELVLEDKLREYFPFDTIIEVGKGVEGADCMMIVRNALGSECGKIIFESKRTKGWNNIWIDKLKNDMRNKQADLAILVTQVFPKGMDCFGEKDGIWLCSFKELGGLASALRNAIIRIAETRKSEENKGEKMQMLYNYLTGLEFRQQIEAIVEGFVSMKNSISKERIQMEKLWKEREKQLDKVLLNTSGMYGSVKGIAGASVQNIPLLEGTSDNEDDMAH